MHYPLPMPASSRNSSTTSDWAKTLQIRAIPQPMKILCWSICPPILRWLFHDSESDSACFFPSSFRYPRHIQSRLRFTVQESKTENQSAALPVPVEPLVAIPSVDRLYANYPSVNPFTSPEPFSNYSNENAGDSFSHYYSQVPVESSYATLSCYSQSPPLQPALVVDEAFKKKRDEAFSWLSQVGFNCLVRFHCFQ